jgi:hypothetical protein
MEDTKNSKVQALSLLYSNSAARATSLSDRQYSVTTTVITLHVLALAGLIADPSKISITHRVLAALAFLLFDAVAAWYIQQKALAYWDCKRVQGEAEGRLRTIAGLTPAEADTLPIETSALRKGFKGSLAFVISICLAYLVILAALISG